MAESAVVIVTFLDWAGLVGGLSGFLSLALVIAGRRQP